VEGKYKNKNEERKKLGRKPVNGKCPLDKG